MLWIDQVMLKSDREYLIYCSYLSNLQKVVYWYLDDPMAEVISKDVLVWFSDKFIWHATV